MATLLRVNSNFLSPPPMRGRDMMKLTMGWLVCGLLILAVVTPTRAQEPQSSDEWTGSVEQKVWGLMTVWAEAKYAFPHFDKLPDLDWDRAVQECIPRVVAADDMNAYYLVLLELVASLEDSHTSIVPPWGHFKPGFDLPPIEVQVVDDRFLITRTGDTEETNSQNLYPGLEIVDVEGTPVATYFEENVLRYHTRGSKQADEAVLTVYLLYGPQGETVILGVKDTDGTSRTVALTRNAMSGGGSPFMYRFIHDMMVAQTIETKMIGEDIVYVRIPNFESSQVAADFLALVDGLDTERVKGMIVDVRYNLGGTSTVCNQVVGCLIDETVTSPVFKYRDYAAAEKAWGKAPKWSTNSIEVAPREGKRYLGPLVVLSGPTTNSSAEDFIIELQYNGRAKVVGERTAGGAGNALVSRLPGGGTLMVSTFTALYPGGEDYVGVGISPDIEVRPTGDDIREGRDSVLDRAIELVNGG
jgi:hypothetical protein